MMMNAHPLCLGPMNSESYSELGASGLQSRTRGRKWNTARCVMLAILLASAGCAPPQQAPQVKPPEVIVTTPVTDTVTDFEVFTGRLDALKTVDVRARVSGYVLTVPFKEGDEVKEGDLLFQIDPDPYQADLDQAEANLKLAQADLNLQEKNAARASLMIDNRSIGREEYDTIIAARAKARATVGSAQAARDRAKLFLGYTRVVAPISGRISRRNVDPGNLVRADDASVSLTRIVTEDPIYAYFDVDERTYLHLVQSSGSPRRAAERGLTVPVMMSLANEPLDKFSRTGTINFVDNRVEANTGTIRMRGVFQNPDRGLRPGMFVRIRLPIGKPYQATLIEDQALMSDQGKNFVFVVDKDGKAVYRPVEAGQAVLGKRVVNEPRKDNEPAADATAAEEVRLRVIRPAAKGREGKEGLSLGERVIVSGQQRVRRGAQVEAVMRPPAEPPGALTRDAAALASSRSASGPSQKPQ
jgi:RND family efflux transporter MFP subunit